MKKFSLGVLLGIIITALCVEAVGIWILSENNVVVTLILMFATVFFAVVICNSTKLLRSWGEIHTEMRSGGNKMIKTDIKKIETITIGKGSQKILKKLKSLKRDDLNNLISDIEKGHFDDYHKDSYAFPKMELADRLIALDLWDLASAVKSGEYDD